jgi:hypothetical protein
MNYYNKLIYYSIYNIIYILYIYKNIKMKVTLKLHKKIYIYLVINNT